MIRLITSGESHGKALSVIIEGMPAGLRIDTKTIDKELSRRQKGYGRGARMEIESDKAEILSGVRFGETIGSPISIQIKNKDFENWKDIMKTAKGYTDKTVTSPRPGHADLAGILKYGRADIRDILERASARETASRVAAGAIFKTFLAEFGINIYSHTISIGKISVKKTTKKPDETEDSPLRCTDPAAEKEMMKLIDEAKEKGDTIGGVSEIRATGVCAGLGSHANYDRRLNALIASSMMSIPTVKGVEVGDGIKNTGKFGSEVQDEILYSKKKGFYRSTNRAGGIEGGISNGEDIVVRIYLKPIPTLSSPLKSVDIKTKKETLAQKERADVCVVPAAGVIAESMMAYVLTGAFLDKFGADAVTDIKIGFKSYMERIENA
jgi:chorismate synthase